MGYRLDTVQNRKGPKTRYIFDVVIAGERFRKRVFCYRSSVESLYRQWEQDIIRGNVDRNYSLFEMLAAYQDDMEKQHSSSSFRHYQRTIALFRKCYRDMPLRKFKRQHVEEFVAWRRSSIFRGSLKQISDNSINREIGVLSSFFSWAIIRDYYVGNNPCFRAKIKTDVRRNIRLSLDQMEELLGKARERGMIYTAILIAVLTGFRFNEVYSLQWPDICFTTKRIYLRKETTKTKRSRSVPMVAYLEQHLLEVRSNKPDVVKVFDSWRTHYALRSQWERLRKTLSFYPQVDLHFHDLRHIFAQSLRDSGVAIDDISAILGHSEIGITQRFYAQEGGINAHEKVERITTAMPLFRTVRD